MISKATVRTGCPYVSRAVCLFKETLGTPKNCHVAVEQNAESAGERVVSLGADLALELGTNDVDLMGLRRTSPKVARSVLNQGVRLISTVEVERELETTVPQPVQDEPSSAKRFDDALATIESHLGRHPDDDIDRLVVVESLATPAK